MKLFYIEYWKIAEALKMSFLVNKGYWKTGIKFISFPAVLLLTCTAEGQVSCGNLECLADPQSSHTSSAVHWMTSEYVFGVNENCVCCDSQSCAVMPVHPYKFSSLSQLPKYSIYNIVFVCLLTCLLGDNKCTRCTCRGQKIVCWMESVPFEFWKLNSVARLGILLSPIITVLIVV